MYRECLTEYLQKALFTSLYIYFGTIGRDHIYFFTLVTSIVVWSKTDQKASSENLEMNNIFFYGHDEFRL